MSKSGIKWSGNLTVGLAGMDARMNRALLAAANYTAPVAEAYMRSNAPWTDQTGAARNGLHANVLFVPNRCAIVLYHSVPYGIFLETRWGGKYAIIEPTIAHIAPLFAMTIKKMVEV